MYFLVVAMQITTKPNDPMTRKVVSRIRLHGLSRSLKGPVLSTFEDLLSNSKSWFSFILQYGLLSSFHEYVEALQWRTFGPSKWYPSEHQNNAVTNFWSTCPFAGGWRKGQYFSKHQCLISHRMKHPYHPYRAYCNCPNLLSAKCLGHIHNGNRLSKENKRRIFWSTLSCIFVVWEDGLSNNVDHAIYSNQENIPRGGITDRTKESKRKQSRKAFIFTTDELVLSWQKAVTICSAKITSTSPPL